MSRYFKVNFKSNSFSFNIYKFLANKLLAKWQSSYQTMHFDINFMIKTFKYISYDVNVYTNLNDKIIFVYKTLVILRDY